MTPSCPRCPDSTLVTSGTHGVWVQYCAHCWGMWVDHASVLHAAGAAVDGATAAAGHGGLACPVCRGVMKAWNAKGVVIDRCDAHGVWFDRAELDHLVAHARQVHGGGSGIATGAAVVGGVAVVAGAAAIAEGQRQSSSPIADAAGTAVEAAADVLPVVDAAPEIGAAAAEVAGGVFEGVSEAVGAIFDLFS